MYLRSNYRSPIERVQTHEAAYIAEVVSGGHISPELLAKRQGRSLSDLLIICGYIGGDAKYSPWFNSHSVQSLEARLKAVHKLMAKYKLGELEVIQLLTRLRCDSYSIPARLSPEFTRQYVLNNIERLPIFSIAYKEVKSTTCVTHQEYLEVLTNWIMKLIPYKNHEQFLLDLDNYAEMEGKPKKDKIGKAIYQYDIDEARRQQKIAKAKAEAEKRKREAELEDQRLNALALQQRPNAGLKKPLQKFGDTELQLRARMVNDYGYIMPADLSIEGGERDCIYYDDNTERRPKLEARAIKEFKYYIIRYEDAHPDMSNKMSSLRRVERGMDSWR